MADPTLEDRIGEIEATITDLLASMHASNHQAVARVRALAAARKAEKEKQA